MARFAVAVGRRFFVDNCLLHASALTYTSLLSIVPLFAIMFAVLKGLGAQQQLEPLLLSRLALDPDTASRIVQYIERTNVGTLGALGAAGLLATVISVLGAIEASFNHIWRVPAQRSYWRKATDYLSAVLVTPFLILAAVGITSTLQQQTFLSWMWENQLIGPIAVRLLHLAPYAINVVALFVLYAIMPNRRPHVPSILLGALFAGCVWQLVQASYVALQIGVARYNAIYGALAQLPVTLVWIYVSWVVVLAGAEIAAVAELGDDAVARADADSTRFALAVSLLLRAAEAFRDGAGAIDPLACARELRANGGLLLEVADRLRRAGFLAAGADDRELLLARDPAAIDLGVVSQIFEPIAPPPGADARVAALMERAASRRRSELAKITVAQLLEEKREAEPAPAPSSSNLREIPDPRDLVGR
ncbi:MAG TPA: YihY/virulence factor BrkB family protein [Candidatus Binatia bacterium]|nr:YihY/virulence factor BrkB family protein [Candidatus Binatia bacterium]